MIFFLSIVPQIPVEPLIPISDQPSGQVELPHIDMHISDEIGECKVWHSYSEVPEVTPEY